MIRLDQNAPDFRWTNKDGSVQSLSDFHGKAIVLYFYPKDDTPGCTKEACSFRDIYDDFLDEGAVVIGVSPDGSTSHEKFRNKFQLPFYLVSDEDHSIADAYGVWGEKMNYGKTYMGVIRTTFIIDASGLIVKIYPKVNPEGHADIVLADLRHMLK